jgi:adenosylcobinamide kinase / adenosylcobinamide-phosphate guanylyltransferase
VTVALPRSELILGGVRSGKSRYALARAREAPGSVAFLATARALDGPMAARITRHRAERPRGWTTVEESVDVAATCRRLAGSHDLVLVDCLTLWVSNRLLRGDDDAAILVEADALAALMAERRCSLLLVSNEVGAGVHPPTEIGLRFADVMGAVNQRVAVAADRVTLLVAGLPVVVKETQPVSSPFVRERAVESP